MEPKTLDDAVAIVGMACRVPGAPDVRAFWENLRNGHESIERWSPRDPLDDSVPPELLEQPTFVRARAMVSDIETFDARFFGYTPAEATLLDPQQRLFLECCWDALEGSGHIVPDEDKLVGVFGGAALSSYLVLHLAPHAALHPIDPLLLNLGNAESFLTTRVSYKLDLRGPSHSVSSACSTSLVAVHLACQSLLNHECDVALAGGVSINLSQRFGYRFVEGGVMSKDGTCRPFDASAGGIVFGSGGGVVALRRLADAVEDGDHIHAIIRGSAINNDGANRVGYTAPSVDGQSEVIIEALANASLDPTEVAYVEAHGTGTALGDPIEVRALAKAYGGGEHRASCAIGSLKGNVGHLDAAAGVLGLIKATLMVEHGELVPSLGCSVPSPLIDWSASGFHVQVEGGPWPKERPRIAGVSSFGMGGTNAHVVLSAAASKADLPRKETTELLLLSAKTPMALESLSVSLAAHVSTSDGPALADAAYTLATTRRRFAYRRACVVDSVAQASTMLRAPLTHIASEPREHRPVVFMFPGQGSQFTGMAETIYRANDSFRAAFDDCREILRTRYGKDIAASVLRRAPDADTLRPTEEAQPALFAVEYALAQAMMAWGIRPTAMIGHSLGEIVAACIAGVLSLADAIDLVVERGRRMQEQPRGAMLSVSLSVDEVRPWLVDDVEVAAINAPSWSVLSGPEAAINALATRLEHAEIRHRSLHTSHAFHSHMMQDAAETMAAWATRLRFQPPQTPFVSNLTGTITTDEQATSPEYWGALIRQPVRFSEGLMTLARTLDDPIWIELGPGRTLGTFVRQSLEKPDAVDTLPGPGDTRDGGQALLSAIGRAWMLGTDLVPPVRAGRCWLPTHPFERQRCWIDAPSRSPVTARTQTSWSADEAFSHHERPPIETSFAEPSNDQERKVASIWRDVLGLEEVGLDDDFFELGGHSLLATTIVGRLREEFETEVPLQRLFEAPTVRATARLLAKRVAHVEDSETSARTARFLHLLAEMTTERTTTSRGQA